MGAKPEIDPYYRCLGIPPAEQPPNHYRLLGLALFEANAEVIDAAALQRNKHLRAFALGPHSDASQNLLNEVAAAKICLSRPEKKAAYDAQLKASLAPAKEPPSLAASQEKPVVTRVAPPLAAAMRPLKVPPAPPPANARPRAPDQTRPTPELPRLRPLPTSQSLPALRRAKRAKQGAWQRIVAAGGTVALLALGFALFGGLGPSDESAARLVPLNRPDSIPAFEPRKSETPPTEGPAPPSMPAPPAVPPEGDSPTLPSNLPAPTPLNATPPLAIAPFDAGQARAHQEAWAAHMDAPVEFANTIGMKFVLIPPGKFMVGSTPAEVDAALALSSKDEDWKEHIRSEIPKHVVTLAQPIYIGVHEVTQAQYEKVVGYNPSFFDAKGPGKKSVMGLDTSMHPVEMVDWNDAIEFCSKLNEREKHDLLYDRSGETATMLEDVGYRLPFDAQWEFACRAGTTTKYWIGDHDDQLLQTSWFDSNSGNRTHAVGALKENPFGLYDVHGNVWEWVQDEWQPHYNKRIQTNLVLNSAGQASPELQHLIRSGDWSRPASRCRASHHDASDVSCCDFTIGFRIALSLDAVKSAIARRKAMPAREPAAWSGWPAGAPPPAIAPFDADDARSLQESWANNLRVPVEYENSIGMKLVLIPPGEFNMGSTPAEIQAALVAVVGPDRLKEKWKEFIRSGGPQHKVILTQPFYIGVHEVRQKDYEAVMDKNLSFFTSTGGAKDAVVGLDTSTHPVEAVSWTDAAEFCAKLSEKERLTPSYIRSGETVTVSNGDGYRLPTEAQWEFAGRGGTTTKYWTGDNEDGLLEAGWSVENSVGRTHAVGEFKANSFGLHDIHGNVCEWLQDWWEPNYYSQFQGVLAIDPTGPPSIGAQRVLRGGNFYSAASPWRSSHRNAWEPTQSDASTGFRLALPVDAVKTGIAIRKVELARATASWGEWQADAPPPAIVPFDADEARVHQDAWATHLGAPAEYENSLGMKFVLIPPGEFTMGSTFAEIDADLMVAGQDEYRKDHIRSEAPQHKVVLTRAYYLGTYEVTQGEYEDVMKQNPSEFAATGSRKDAVVGLDTSTQPVESVSWSDAAEFCSKLSKKEKLKPFYVLSRETVKLVKGTGYRLPTEAEWEFACRGGTATKYWTGDMDKGAIRAGWSAENSLSQPHAVGELKANPFGLYDVQGNVSEWVQDSWDAKYYTQFEKRLAMDPIGPTSAGAQRVLRGGNHYNLVSRGRSGSRFGWGPLDRDSSTGLRLTLEVDTVKAAIAKRRD